MSAAEPALAALACEIAALSAQTGRAVKLDPRAVADRSDELDLLPPTEVSPNGSCRMVRAQDGWIAVNLPREDDRRMVPAWIGCALDAEPWAAIAEAARAAPWRDLVTDARLLGLPVAGVGEIGAPSAAPAPLVRLGAPGSPPAAPRVLDLSAMWAGPLCGAVLAEAGALVVKMESRTRPDAVRFATPGLFRRLNESKRQQRFDMESAEGVARLKAMMVSADVVITSARPRAFAARGLSPEAIFAANPHLVWVAVTGYGWFGAAGERVAFGDDAAAAGGLVRWSEAGAPLFLGDALADPITGLAAAAGALRALAQGGGYLVDAAMARCAAKAASEMARAGHAG